MGKIQNSTKNSHKPQPYKKNLKEKKIKKKKYENVKDKDDVSDELEVNQDVLTLEVIKDLGGTEEDLALLDNIDGEDNGKEINGETKEELLNLVKSLNFSKFKSQLVVKDKEYEDENKQEIIEGAAKDNEISNGREDKDEAGNKEDEDEENETFDEKPDFFFLKDKHSTRTHCVIKTGAGQKWYEATNVEVGDTEESLTNKYWIQKLEKYTKVVWDKDIENYNKASQKGSKRSETQWIQTVLKSGTLNDKFSAYVILLQDSPIHNISVLETFVDFVSLKSRRPCLMAMESLQQIFVEVLLLPTRKLKNFDKNPFSKLSELTGGNKETRDRYLISWMFEDKLKKLYLKFLDNMELVGKDSIEKTKIKALSTTLELLVGNPEQEDILLGRLINKLGDPTRSIAAKAMYLLSQLLEKHSAMKWVVVGEVERLLYRPNISAKAQYFGICFLSQIILEKFNQDNLAAKLIKIYFSFFKVSVKKGEVDTKLMKALLTGVNRAFPYARLDPGELDQQMETIHKLVHLVSFNISIQALTLLYQVMDSREAVTDRFYSALYKKILDPELTTSSKQVMFLNLLYKAMKADSSADRVRSFMKRLLQIISYQPSHLVCGLLFLISELAKAKPDIMSASEVTVQDTADKFDDSDEEEHYDDVEEDEAVTDKKSKRKESSGWTFKSKSSVHSAKSSYDPSCRNPLYSGATGSDYWELTGLQQHFHPSAALFAKQIREREVIKYSGDPLSDFTIARFLDRFVFRNPKKDPEKNKPSTVLGKRNIYRPAGIKAVAPDSKDFLNRDVNNVPSDELYIYKYFQEKLQRKGAKDDNEDAASVTSEEFNNFLDSYGRKADFDDEDLDFAGGLREEAEDDNIDEDDEVNDDEKKNEDSDEDEPAGLDGEEDDDNFKDLSSGDESEENMEVDADDKGLDEEGFGDDSFDEEGFGASEEDDEDEEPMLKSKGRKKSKPKFGKFNAADLSSLLADAEEFSHLIEENEDDGMASSLANKDKASKKQLSWEKDNDNFMKKGKQWGNKKKFSKGKHNVKKSSAFKQPKKKS